MYFPRDDQILFKTITQIYNRMQACEVFFVLSKIR